MPFSDITAYYFALTLLVGRPEGHPACKILGIGLLVGMATKSLSEGRWLVWYHSTGVIVPVMVV